VQAVEKLVLAEGTKIAMTKVQSAYDQGVYGLVVNLGSIAARLLLQPFEEAAFMSFSQPVAKGEDPLARLIPLVKVAILFGESAAASLSGNSSEVEESGGRPSFPSATPRGRARWPGLYPW